MVLEVDKVSMAMISVGDLNDDTDTNDASGIRSRSTSDPVQMNYVGHVCNADVLDSIDADSDGEAEVFGPDPDEGREGNNANSAVMMAAASSSPVATAAAASSLAFAAALAGFTAPALRANPALMSGPLHDKHSSNGNGNNHNNNNNDNNNNNNNNNNNSSNNNMTGNDDAAGAAPFNRSSSGGRRRALTMGQYNATLVIDVKEQPALSQGSLAAAESQELPQENLEISFV